MDFDIYRGKNVLITGHTGFKGSWLAAWLQQLNANLTGIVLAPNTKPEIIFHLAAQSLVRDSYQDPIYTFETNVIGTVNVLNICRDLNSLKAVVNEPN